MKEIIEQYKEEQVLKLKQWYLDNPGKIMNNYDIRISACNTVLQGNFTISEMETIRDAALLLYRARTGVSGWYITAETYNELITLCKNSQ